MNHMFTTFGQVLIVIAAQPDIRIREIAQRLRITERTVMHALTDLTDTGIVRVKRRGRKNVYEVSPQTVFPVANLRVSLDDLVSLMSPERNPRAPDIQQTHD